MLSVLASSLEVKVQLARNLFKPMVRRSGQFLHTDCPALGTCMQRRSAQPPVFLVPFLSLAARDTLVNLCRQILCNYDAASDGFGKIRYSLISLSETMESWDD